MLLRFIRLSASRVSFRTNMIVAFSGALPSRDHAIGLTFRAMRRAPSTLSFGGCRRPHMAPRARPIRPSSPEATIRP
jgi:hypothetical protein